PHLTNPGGQAAGRRIPITISIDGYYFQFILPDPSAGGSCGEPKIPKVRDETSGFLATGLAQMHPKYLGHG
ncbi:MAG: hypothetical protein IIB44_05845, partial [Candidatus Marinimicrobia bacterium]|nr:hypothetical protein [Candidatus Neomarinimicrobiota bacterium]